MSQLVSIVYKPKTAPSPKDEYLRLPCEQAQLVAGYGIEGDAKGGGNTRHLNLMSAHIVQELAGEGFRAVPGQLGEQLIVAGLDVDTLPCGTRLRIGDQACVELVEPRTGCAKFERFQDKSRQQCAGRMGMMARVLVSGTIAVGDPVSVVTEPDA